MKPSIPSGMRDFSSEDVYKRQHIFSIIKNVFEKYGYQPIETPTMENLTTLEGKYGEEGDKLLFRVLQSGNYSEAFNNILDDLIDRISKEIDVLNDKFQKIDFKSLNPQERDHVVKPAYDLASRHNQLVLFRSKIKGIIIPEKGLRYDLTVPFARYVVMHQNEITFPFKRYQIQSVFRADRPQKGRYREFYQCDADVVGSDSLLNEVELIQIYDEVFSKLGINVSIRFNHRKIFEGIAKAIDPKNQFNATSVAIILDKLEKIGLEGVKNEMSEKGGDTLQFANIDELVNIASSTDESNSVQDIDDPYKFQRHKIWRIINLLSSDEYGAKDLLKIFELFQNLPLKNSLQFDPTLARGLNYYTGTILEVLATSGSLKSSLGGGGRYDDLTGIFGLKNVSGVGISFGADRIYDVMEELKLFPEATQKGTSVLFINFDEASVNFILPVLKKIRDAGIAAEIYPSAEKLKKQMKYADDKKIPFVVFAGEDERNSNQLTIKNMNTGEQEKIAIEEIIFRLKEKLT